MSQKQAYGLSVDLKPKLKRSGSPGQTITYIAVLKSHLKVASEWDVLASISPPGAPGLSVSAQPLVKLKPGGQLRMPVAVKVVMGAEAGREVKVVLNMQNIDTQDVVEVQRYFTVAGGTHHPR